MPRQQRRATKDRSRAGRLGAICLLLMFILCVVTLPYTTGRVAAPAPAATPDADAAPVIAHQPRRFERADLDMALMPPFWAPHAPDERARRAQIAEERGALPRPILGTDRLGRDLFTRVMVGGGISLTIGLSAAAIAVILGTLWGTIAAATGGRTDAVMMRIVDIFYGLPSILLVVLFAVAVDGLIDRGGWDLAPESRQMIALLTLLVAIGAVSWLTLARVVRGQVLSIRERPFMEACRAIGVSPVRQFTHHLLPNLIGPITVYATLAVPSAILAESFLSFLGIGVREPLPSWGNLAADGLNELNVVRSRWWLLLWPCLFIALTLFSLNLVGESLRERWDPVGRGRMARRTPTVTENAHATG